MTMRMLIERLTAQYGAAGALAVAESRYRMWSRRANDLIPDTRATHRAWYWYTVSRVMQNRSPTTGMSRDRRAVC